MNSISIERVEKIRSIVRKFEDKCLEWNRVGLDVVFNSKLLTVNWNDIQSIVVADNPGIDEKRNNEYLFCDQQTSSEKSGAIARKILPLLSIEIESNTIILNKCPIYSNATDELRNVNQISLKTTQSYMARMIVLITDILQCQVYVFGLGNCFRNGKLRIAKRNGEYYSNSTLAPFFDVLRRYAPKFQLISNIHIYKHFSRYSVFQDLSFYNYDEGRRIISIEAVTIDKIIEKRITSHELFEALDSSGYSAQLFHL